VLVVDDDEMTRIMLGSFFRRQGIAVWTAGAGMEAVEIFAIHGHEIGLVLLDLCMPEMDGPQTLSKLQQIREDVVCYFMSSDWYPYSEEELMQMGADALLAKSVLCKTLVHLLHSGTPMVAASAK